MNKQSTYVAPGIDISTEENLRQFLDRKEDTFTSFFNQSIHWKRLNKETHLFILGEPGYGKTRLFQELYKEFVNEKKECCRVDLKAVEGKLVEFLRQYLKNERIKRKNVSATLDFKIENSDRNVLFLDAMDEAFAGHIPYLIEDIQYLSSQFPALKIFVSCRTHHILRYRADLNSLNFKCAQVRAFDIRQTIAFLKANCETLEAVDDDEILKQLKATNMSSFSFFHTQSQPTLATPRYLEIIAELATESSLESVLELNRHELFERIIIERLKKEAKKHRKSESGYGMLNSIYIIKQYLERLALLMKMQRVNVLSKDDFSTFNLDVEINLNQNILHEHLLDETLLKDNIDTLEFDNTEFQEYLAAKAISRLGRTRQLVFDLAIEQNLKNIYPSWVNVVGYLIELHPELLLPLVKFGRRQEKVEIFNLIKYYQAEPSHDIDDRTNIFTEIFDYFTEKKDYIPYWIIPELYKFYSNKVHYAKLEKVYFDNLGNDIIKNNIFRLLFFIFRSKVLSDEKMKYWKGIMLGIADDTDLTEHLANEAMRTLGTVSTIEELKPFDNLSKKFDKKFRDTLVSTYIKIDANHVKTIQGILQKISQEETSLISYKLDKIDKKEGFVFFFSESLADEIIPKRKRNLVSAINNNITFHGEIEPLFFQNLSKVWDKEIEELVIRFLIKSIEGYFDRRSSFFLRLSKVLTDANKSIAFKILEQIKKHPERKITDHSSMEFLGNIIRPEDFLSFYKKALELGVDKNDVWWMLRMSSNEELSLLEKDYFPKKYADALKNREEQELKSTNKKANIDVRQIKIYEKFLDCLNKKHVHVFEYYEYDKLIIEERITKSCKKKLVNFALDYIQNNDPQEGKVEVKGDTTTTSGVGYIMPIALDIVHEAGVNLNAYRSKLLRLLPFSFKTETIFEAIPDITFNEFSELLEWFEQSREDSLYLSGIDNIVELIEKNQIRGASDFVIQAVKNGKLSHYKRIHALKLLRLWNEQAISFYEDLFREVVVTVDFEKETGRWSDNCETALAINEILIQKEIPEAIDWRMKKVQDFKYELAKHYSGVRSPSKSEDLGEPLKFVKDLRFKDKIIAYLESSFHILKDNKDYYGYVKNEYWDIVVNYFSHLKTHKNQLSKFLQELRDILQKNISIQHAYDFTYEIGKIEKEYLAYLSEPAQFAPCVQQYNRLKAKQYIDIAYSRELFELIVDVINNELRDWVNQGYYGVIQDLVSTKKGGAVGKERLIQKTLVTQLEKFLHKRGLRYSDVQEISWNFYREAEKLDGEKTDLIITYGAVGSVMVEIKRAGNGDLSKGNRKDYRNKIIAYMQQSNCEYGIFLIFRTEPKAPVYFDRQIKEVKQIYEDLDNVRVIGLDCVK